MARALYGHTGADPLLQLENAQLRSRIAQLEAKLADLQAQRDDDALERELTQLAAGTPALA